jgi:hypothetical protein
MREETDEAKKVLRNGGSIWHAVFRKRDLTNAEDAAGCKKMIKECFDPA